MKAISSAGYTLAVSADELNYIIAGLKRLALDDMRVTGYALGDESCRYSPEFALLLAICESLPNGEARYRAIMDEFFDLADDERRELHGR